MTHVHRVYWNFLFEKRGRGHNFQTHLVFPSLGSNLVDFSSLLDFSFLLPASYTLTTFTEWLAWADDNVTDPKCYKLFLKRSKFWQFGDYIWINHEKCIKISTNMPSIALVNAKTSLHAICIDNFDLLSHIRCERNVSPPEIWVRPPLTYTE